MWTNLLLLLFSSCYLLFPFSCLSFSLLFISHFICFLFIHHISVNASLLSCLILDDVAFLPSFSFSHFFIFSFCMTHSFSPYSLESKFLSLLLFLLFSCVISSFLFFMFFFLIHVSLVFFSFMSHFLSPFDKSSLPFTSLTTFWTMLFYLVFLSYLTHSTLIFILLTLIFTVSALNRNHCSITKTMCGILEWGETLWWLYLVLWVTCLARCVTLSPTHVCLLCEVCSGLQSGKVCFVCRVWQVVTVKKQVFYLCQVASFISGWPPV